MKEHIGKILFAFIAIAIIVSIGIAFKAIFSNGIYMDSFFVWLIFTAENIKNVLKSGWNTAFCFFGTIMLLAWLIYTAVRLFSTKDVKLEELEVDLTWDQKKEQIFQKYGKYFWKIGLTLWALSLSMDFVAAAIPTAKQSAVIYIVPKIINNAEMREIPQNLATLVNEGLKEMIKDVKGETVEAVKDAAKEAVGAAKEKAKDVTAETAEKVKEKLDKR